MRPILVLLVTVALASSAGCFGKDDGGDTTPTPPTTTGSTPTTPTGTTPPTATPTPPTSNGTTRPAPREVGTGSFNFAQPPADPQNPLQVGTPFAVPAGYSKLILNVTWTPTTPGVSPPSVSMSVDIVDAAGTVIANCAGPAPAPAAPPPCTAEGAFGPAAGEVTPRGHGGGPYTAAFSVMAS